MDLRIDNLYAAISYAPLGVRDAASRSLQDLLGDLLSPTLDAMDQVRAKHAGLPDFTPKLLSLEAERKRLEGAYNDALVFFSAIAGERANGHQTHEQTAREWLMRHAKHKEARNG